MLYSNLSSSTTTGYIVPSPLPPKEKLPPTVPAVSADPYEPNPVVTVKPTTIHTFSAPAPVQVVPSPLPSQAALPIVTSTSATHQTTATSTTTSTPSPATTTRAPVAPPPPPASQSTTRSPVEFLKDIFARNEYGHVLMPNVDDYTSFLRPTQEATDAYDLTVVQAIRHNDLDRLRSMLREGKSFNACNRFGESLIHMVCRRGNVELATFLIKEACVDVDVRDDFGRTPLHDACWTSKPNLPMIDLLLNNVSPDMLLTEDVRGHTPFEYARKEHYEEWCNYLAAKEDDLQRRITTFALIR